jgi:hypothetical protein
MVLKVASGLNVPIKYSQNKHNICIPGDINTVAPSIWHPQDQTVKDYQIFWFIRWYLHAPKFLQVIFCYCSYTWAAQLIRRVFHLVSPSAAGTLKFHSQHSENVHCQLL